MGAQPLWTRVNAAGGRPADLASCADANPAPRPPPLGCIPIFWIPSRADGHRHLRRSEGPRPPPRSAVKKTACGSCGRVQLGWYDRKVRRVRDLSCGDTRVYLDVEVRRVACRACEAVKQERLDFLADNPFYTKRFAFYVGRRCRASPITDVAKELRLDWHTVKALEQQYMSEQLRRAGTPGPTVLGLDEVSIKKGHTYRIVVSDLVRQRPIWFGGQDRSEASLDQFYAWLGPRKATRIRLAVMDMWKPFRLATARHAPQASILFDKFHVLRHLGDALDQVRKSEYARLSGRQRRFIKGQKYTLLARRENLTLSGRQALTTLLRANQRLHIAYLLKESFGQLWDYRREAWARRFFETWRVALRWQRLRPYEKFAAMVDRHWDGLAAYCHPENKVALGFVEGLNNKIRVLQRRAYGLRDEEYLLLTILTCMLRGI